MKMLLAPPVKIFSVAVYISPQLALVKANKIQSKMGRASDRFVRSFLCSLSLPLPSWLQYVCAYLSPPGLRYAKVGFRFCVNKPTMSLFTTQMHQACNFLFQSFLKPTLVLHPSQIISHSKNLRESKFFKFDQIYIAK